MDGNRDYPKTDTDAQAANAVPEAAPSGRKINRAGRARVRQGDARVPVRVSKRLIVVIGVATAVAILIGLVWLLAGGVAVIDLTGWAVGDAQTWADGKGVNLRILEEYSDALETGRILSQDVKGGETIHKGDFIAVTVSKGHDLSVELPLPDFMTMTKDQIDAWTNENYMANVYVSSKFSDTVEAGGVISVYIGDNSVVDKVKRDTYIAIVVSKGREDAAGVMISVPDFSDKTVLECHQIANENGIQLEIVEQYDDYIPKGSVISQSLKANDVMKKGDTVMITVSKGKKVIVPDFSAYTKQASVTSTSDLKIPVVILERYSDLPIGKLISQSIAPGTVLEDGDVLQLVFSLGNKVLIANYIGKTRDTIESWVKSLNDQGASITLSASFSKSESLKDKIIYQDKKDTYIGIKSTIKITISLGKPVFVPDFVAPAGSGYGIAVTYAKAVALCKQLNLVPLFVSSKKSGRLPGEIWYQSIPAGKEVTEGTTITLKYNPANVVVTVPDFDGMTKEEVLAQGYAMKLDITFVVTDDYVEGYAGKVYRQSVAAGFEVVSGSAITLTLSPDPAESTSPP